jgi:diguanylate cyclase (GGDEF)-like protein
MVPSKRMPDDAKPRAHRGAPLHTQPFDDDSNSMRAALQNELRRSVSPSLIVILGPDVGARVVLDRSVELGRDPACELPLHDENVSWHHARVEDRGNGDFSAIDLASTNGTLVNGLPCDGSIPLKPGDRIFIGMTVLEMHQDALHDAQAAELERLLSIDDLSGLLVRRRFDAHLASGVAAVLAGTSPSLSVVVMDLDGVKEINDTHGHSMGAFVIGEAGHVIGAHVTGRGFATRFGGDEFAVALPGVPKSDAVAIADGIRAAVVAHVYEKDGICVRPGLSGGIATMPGDAGDAESLFRAADQAMYRAKRAGKNRVAT